MSVVKVKIQKDFTIVYNGVLENPSLSFKAKGLWAYCMSRPDNWQFHVSHLATVSQDGTDAIYSALKELEKAGLVEKTQSNKGGKFGSVDYIIYPYPKEIQIILPLRDFPQTEDPQTENPALTSTDSKKEMKKEPVCTPTPVGAELDKIVVVKKKKPDGQEFEVSLQEIFRQATLRRKVWTTKEIQEAFIILRDYDAPIRDWFNFVEGTIKNQRNVRKGQEYSKMQNKGKKPCQTQESNTSTECNANSSAKDTKEYVSIIPFLTQK